jgi:hypothetical protein
MREGAIPPDHIAGGSARIGHREEAGETQFSRDYGIQDRGLHVLEYLVTAEPLSIAPA